MVSLKSDGNAILGIFIGTIIAVVMIASIANQVTQETSTYSVANESLTAPAVNGTLDLDGRELVPSTTQTCCNSTNESHCTLLSDGFNIATVTSSSTSLLTVQLQINDSGSVYEAQTINCSYDYRPEGYLNLTGARAITLLITLFAALAIVIFVIVTAIGKGSLGNLIRRR